MMLNEHNPINHLQIILCFKVLKGESQPKTPRNPAKSAFGITGEVSDFEGAMISRGGVSRVAKSLVHLGLFIVIICYNVVILYYKSINLYFNLVYLDMDVLRWAFEDLLCSICGVTSWHPVIFLVGPCRTSTMNCRWPQNVVFGTWGFIARHSSQGRKEHGVSMA